jgi:hypothetical protein
MAIRYLLCLLWPDVGFSHAGIFLAGAGRFGGGWRQPQSSIQRFLSYSAWSIKPVIAICYC